MVQLDLRVDLRPDLPSGLLSHQQRGEEKQSLYLAAGVCSPELQAHLSSDLALTALPLCLGEAKLSVCVSLVAAEAEHFPRLYWLFVVLLRTICFFNLLS